MNWTGRGYVFPRDHWRETKKREELKRPGVYVLIGYELDELGAERPVAYIGEGFERAVVGERAWWAVRVGEKHRDSLRWIAIYQVLPIAAITHLAEIDRFEPYGDSGKWKIAFKGPAEELATPIPYGDAPSGAMQGPRYVTRRALLAAKSVKDLMR